MRRLEFALRLLHGPRVTYVRPSLEALGTSRASLLVLPWLVACVSSTDPGPQQARCSTCEPADAGPHTSAPKDSGAPSGLVEDAGPVALPEEDSGPSPAEPSRDAAVIIREDSGVDGGEVAPDDSFTFDLPPGFPPPPVPEDNPMTRSKVELGRHLFYDKRLSRNETTSCASCHHQELAFTDGLAVSVGSTGQATPRSAMTLGNVAYNSTLTWANPLMVELERQALVPMFGDAPVELGLTNTAEFEERLRNVPVYRTLFAQAFPESEEPITLTHVVQALSSFERTLISGNSPFDQYLYGGETRSISAEAIRGYELFNSEKLECFHCHVGFNLSDHVTYAGKPFIDRPFHNTGLYNIDGNGGYPEPNTGVFSVTQDPGDMGRFRAPSLRNIGVTAPYMHDGSIATLSEVLDHYAAGGRTISAGPHAGVGSESPFKSPLLVGFELTEEERRSVLAFLESLTDETFLTSPAFTDPWPQEVE